MAYVILLVFVIGYLMITLEHPLKLDKAVSALLMGTLVWALLALGFNEGWLSVINSHGEIFSIAQGEKVSQNEGFYQVLMHHFNGIGEILFFLIGAMTIVEIVDLHRGFDIIKNNITTKSKIKLLWTLSILAFFLSAVIDNLTSTIILISVLRKLVPRVKFRIWFAAFVVIAANAGGAWSPIGDVTTTMLWIANKITAYHVIIYVFLPAVVCLLVPLLIASRLKAFKGDVPRKIVIVDEASERLLSSKAMLYTGLGAIAFVPIFKTVTGLPPYMGMMLSLGVVWLVSEYIRPEKNLTPAKRREYSAHKALSKIEFSSILFFLGILLAVAGLESMVFGQIDNAQVGTLQYVAESLTLAIPNMEVIAIILGGLSAVVDNVPLVAASIAMFDFPIDDSLWHLIAYTTGTGGSMLIIGSAAGVAAMGMEKIDFIWYLKNITLLALAGFLVGALVFILQFKFIF